MFKRILKWLGVITAVLVIAIAIFLVNLIWFRPWSLNLFYDKVFAEILFDHPEILSTLGLVEQFGITVITGNSTTNRLRINSANSTGGSAIWPSSASIRSIANRLRKSFPRACWTGF